MPRRCGNGWAVRVNGRAFYVDAAASRGRWSFLVRESGAAAVAEPVGAEPYASYEVAVETRAAGEQVIYVDGQPVPVSVADPRSLFGRRLPESSAEAGPARILAPMPGRIVRILVKPGDVATAGQPLVVVEAMKMENELRAPRSGVVTEIRVDEGMSIEANTVLIVLH
jgi:biotin carboxyl carrier protein